MDFKAERLILAPFPQVDAALHELLVEQRAIFTQLSGRRVPITAGSTRYILRTGGGIETAAIRIRMVGNGTHLIVERPTAASESPAAAPTTAPSEEQAQRDTIVGVMLQSIMLKLVAALEADQRRMERLEIDALPQYPELAAVDPERIIEQLSTEPKTPKRTSKPSWPEDDWAWQQVNVLERAPGEVFVEWQRRLSPRRPALRDQGRSFRHAIRRTRLVMTENS